MDTTGGERHNRSSGNDTRSVRDGNGDSNSLACRVSCVCACACGERQSTRGERIGGVREPRLWAKPGKDGLDEETVVGNEHVVHAFGDGRRAHQRFARTIGLGRRYFQLCVTRCARMCERVLVWCVRACVCGVVTLSTVIVSEKALDRERSVEALLENATARLLIVASTWACTNSRRSSKI